MMQNLGEMVVILGCFILVSIGFDLMRESGSITMKDLLKKIVGGGLIIGIGLAMYYFKP